jgi:hypothetical protein
MQVSRWREKELILADCKAALSDYSLLVSGELKGGVAVLTKSSPSSFVPFSDA